MGCGTLHPTGCIALHALILLFVFAPFMGYDSLALRCEAKAAAVGRQTAAPLVTPDHGLDWIGLDCVLGGSRHADWEIMDEQGNKKSKWRWASIGDEVFFFF